MRKKDSNKDNNKITINKRTLVISLIMVVSLSVFLVVSGPLSSLMLPPIKRVNAQQQPSSQAQQPTSRPQQPTSGTTTTTTTSSPTTSSSSTSSSYSTTSPTSTLPSSSASPSSIKLKSCSQKLQECENSALKTKQALDKNCRSTKGVNLVACLAIATLTYQELLNNCQNDFQKCQIPQCPQGTTMCKPDECDDLTSDPNNCGACGHVCPGGSLCSPDPTTGTPTCSCPAGEQVCNGQCIATNTDLNCGGCGVTCTGSTTCKADSSASGGYSCQCATGQLGDNNNCGACGAPCTGGQTCQSNTCQCPAGQQMCNGQCTSLTTNENCGSCGNNCGSSTYPAGSQCVQHSSGSYSCQDVPFCLPGNSNTCPGQCVQPFANVCVQCSDCVTIGG